MSWLIYSSGYPTKYNYNGGGDPHPGSALLFETGTPEVGPYLEFEDGTGVLLLES